MVEPQRDPEAEPFGQGVRGFAFWSWKLFRFWESERKVNLASITKFADSKSHWLLCRHRHRWQLYHLQSMHQNHAARLWSNEAGAFSSMSVKIYLTSRCVSCEILLWHYFKSYAPADNFLSVGKTIFYRLILLCFFFPFFLFLLSILPLAVTYS